MSSRPHVPSPREGSGWRRGGRLRKATRPVLGLVVLLLVVAVGFGAARAGGAGDWSTLSPQDQSELTPFIEAWRYITSDYAGPVDRQALVDGAIRGMVDALGDPHSSYFTPSESAAFTDSLSGTYEGVGLVITADPGGAGALVQEVLAGGPADAAGIRAGDVITAVNGSSVAGFPVEVVASLLKGPSGTAVTLTLRRGKDDASAPAQVRVVRGVLDLPSVTSRVLAPGIAYVKIDQFNQNTGDQFLATLSRLRGDGGNPPEAGPGGLKGLVLDLRGNPGGYVDAAVKVAGALVKSGPVVRIVDGHGNEVDFPSAPTGPIPAIAVLVDGNTASAAEIVSGALQDNGAALIGRQTYGKGSVQSLIPLAGGGTLKLTGAHYFTPKRRAIDHIGLTPDLVVTPGSGPVPGLAPWGDATAYYRDSGPDVLALQQRLRLLGYADGDGDGFFGPDTLRALASFEEDHHLDTVFATTEAVKAALDDAVASFVGAAAPGDTDLAAALEYLRTGRLPAPEGK